MRLIRKIGYIGLFYLIQTIWVIQGGYAQGLNRIEKKAISSFEKGNYVKARELFTVLKDSGYHENNTASFLAQCYFELHEPEISKNLLSQLSNPNQENLYLLILANYFSEGFEAADQLLADFKDTANFDIQNVEKRVKNATELYEDSKGYVIQNFGQEINSNDREYSAVMYNDFNQLLFTSRKESSDVTDSDGLAYETIYSTSIDSTNQWKAATPLNIKLEQDKKHDATVQVYQSGTKMISYHDGQLYSSTLNDGEWSKDGDLTIHDTEGSDTHCYLTDDEKTIIFASDYKSYGQHLDLFVSQKSENGKWSEPKPLTVFNTNYDEDAPFLASDSTFYFSSRGHNSLGGYDVFKSTFNDESGEWGPPVNLGHPINTVAEDTYYSTDGKLGYISSSRLGGYGSLDLYRVFLFNKIMIEGVLEDENSVPIADAEIEIAYDSLLLKSYTDINGHYEMFVPISKNIQVTFIKDSLNLYEGEYIVNIFFKDKNDNTFNFHIDYSSLSTEKPEGAVNNHAVKNIPIGVKNDYSMNPIIAVTQPKMELSWADSLNRETELKRQRELEKRNIESHTCSVFFENNEYSINAETKKSLDQLIEEIKLIDPKAVEIVGHTDIKGVAEKNEKLSILRARSVQKYMVSKGIDYDKTLIKGYGSTYLLDIGNDQAAHEKNRRVEIKY